MPPLRVAICGGGIGGLTTARCLFHKFQPGAVHVRVYERSPHLSPAIGGPLTLAGGFQVLRALGQETETQRRSLPCWYSEVRRGKESFTAFDLRGLLSKDDQKVLGETAMIFIMRAALLELLVSRLPEGVLQLGKPVTKIEEVHNGVSLVCADGTSDTVDILIGADGIRSATRVQLHGPFEPAFFNATSFGGRVQLDRASFERFIPERDRHAIVQYVSSSRSGHYAIVIPCAENEVCWGFIETNYVQEAPEWGTTVSREYARKMIAEWEGSPLTQLLELTPDSQLTRRDLYYQPDLTKKWTKGRIALVGDSAHAMLPFVGQGANQAMQDGASLARALSQHCSSSHSTTSISAAFAQYEQERTSVAVRLAKTGQIMGRMQMSQNPVIGFLRDFLNKHAVKIPGMKRQFVNELMDARAMLEGKQ